MSRTNPTPPPSPAIASALARVIAAAKDLIAASVEDEGGAKIVAEAQAKGHKFAVLVMIPEGRCRVDLVTADGERAQLFSVTGA